MSQQTTKPTPSPSTQREQHSNFQPEQSEPAYTEGGKFGRQEGQPGSKGPAVENPTKPVGPIPQDIKGQYPHDKNQADGGTPEEHPKGG